MSGDYIVSLAIIATSFAATLGLTVWARKILLGRALLDRPNERSSHTTPTPRGGGWAILAVLVPGMMIAALKQGDFVAYAGPIAGTVLLAAISWIDDRKGTSVIVRLGVHILAAALGTLAFDHSQILLGGALPFWLDRAVTVLGWAWFINLYNFMDGIDGITGVETASIATGVCVVMSAAGMNDAFVDTLTLLLTGACLGFLALNWHPAKIFLGDVGSVPLGYLAGFALLSLALHGHPAPALILPLYYLADSGITIAKRAARGEKIWQAHRQHFYQQAAQGYGRHDRVVYGIILVNAGLIGAALLAVTQPLEGLGIAALLVAILLGNMHKAGMKSGQKP